MDAACRLVTEVFCFDVIPYHDCCHRRQKPTWQGSCETTGSPERKWERETKGERTTSLFHFHPLLPPLLLPRLAPPPLSSPPLPSSPGWACQPLERQSDMPSAAGYHELIKGGWRRRIQPNQGGSWRAGREPTVPRLRWTPLTGSDLMHNTWDAQKSLSMQARGTLFMTLRHWRSLMAGSTAGRSWRARRTNLSLSCPVSRLYLLRSGVRGQEKWNLLSRTSPSSFSLDFPVTAHANHPILLFITIKQVCLWCWKCRCFSQERAKMNRI